MLTAIRMRVLWSLAQTSFPHFVTTGTGLLSSTCYLPQAVSPALCACTCLKFYRAVGTIVYFCAVLQRGSHLHQDTASVCMNNGKCKQSHLPAPVLKLVFVSVTGTNSSYCALY